MPSKIKQWQFITYNKLHVYGITLFPFIVIQHPNLLNNKTFVNHEHIHLRQQIELLVIPFYLLYLMHYCINLIKYKNHDKAYRNICFEREAYRNESKINYLVNRKFWSWLKYL